MKKDDLVNLIKETIVSINIINDSVKTITDAKLNSTESEAKCGIFQEN